MSKTILFIDSRVSDYQALVAGLSSDTAWVLLNADEDGVLQIQAALAIDSSAAADKFDSIQIISHGSAGSLLLGSTVLDQSNLSVYQNALNAIGNELTLDGDLFLYGCDVASGDKGSAFVAALAQATGADVAASTGRTGAAGLGGNWVLESHTGAIDAAPSFSGPGPAAYQGLLVPNTAPSIGHLMQLGFAPKVDYGTGSSPYSLTSLDANGDGKLDLVAANFLSNTVSVLLGNGDGSFATKTDYATGTFPNSVAALDANNDGKLDLVAVNRGSDSVSVFLNNGNGTYAAKVDYATGSSPRSVASVDANGDGWMDLAIANYFSTSVSVLLNQGNGTYAAKSDYGTGGNPSFVTSLDANADGKVDLVVANAGSQSVSVLLGDGLGSFAPKADYDTNGSGPNSVTGLDANGDGKLDLAVVNSNDRMVSVLLNNGDGTFAVTSPYYVGPDPYSLTNLDANGDGRMDLAVTAWGTNKVSVMLNNGDGRFTAMTDFATGAKPYFVTSLDADGDGKPDLAVADAGSGAVSVLLNTSTAGSTATAFTEQTAVAAAANLFINDPDGNSDWNGGTLQVQITANNEAADTIFLPTAYTGGGAIWLDPAGNKIMAAFTQIGTADAASVTDGSAWTFTFNASATNASVQLAAQALKFDNTSDAPGTSDRTVTFTATDSGGLAGIGTHSITVAAVNDAPAVSDVPVTADAVITGAAAVLADFTVGDLDGAGVALSVTLTESNGTVNGLVDTDLGTAGIQLSGTAASINATIASATFTASAAGAASIGISVSDGVAAAVTATYNLMATDAPPPEVPPPPPGIVIDGVLVTTAPGDHASTILTIPVIPGTRLDKPGSANPTLADIPLVTGINGHSIVQVSVPIGVGLQAQGPSAFLSGSAAASELGYRIERVAGSNGELTHNGLVFLARIDPLIPLYIQTITPIAGAGFDPDTPLVISGSSATSDGMQAIILDARALPEGALIQVDNIDFIAIVGPVRVIGGAGQNMASGDAADQWIVLGANDDAIHGGGGNDVVAGKGGNDRLFGDDGDDTIVGGTGNDHLEGGAGNDILQGGMSDAGAWSFALNADGSLQVSYAASQKLLTDVHSAVAAGNWIGGPVLDASLAAAFADYGQLETISLLFQGLTGELPTLQSLNAISGLGLNQAELVQAAWNWYEATLPAYASTQSKLAALITQTWGQDEATAEHIQICVDFLAQGGTWAQALSFFVESAPVRSAITTNGQLQLTQAGYLGERGWGADSGDDTLLGGAGNDVLIGGGGNNILDGGEGIDMAVLWGNVDRFSFQLRTVDGPGEVLLRNALTGEQDILRSVELLQFGGQAYRLQTDALQQGQSYQLGEHLHALTAQELVLVGLPTFE